MTRILKNFITQIELYNFTHVLTYSPVAFLTFLTDYLQENKCLYFYQCCRVVSRYINILSLRLKNCIF